MERLTTLHEMIIAEKDKQIAILQQTIKDMELRHQGHIEHLIQEITIINDTVETQNKDIKILKELLK